MTTFDTIVVVVLSISVIYSLFRGMIKEIFSLLAIIIGYLAAVKYNHQFAQELQGAIDSEPIARAVAFGLLYFGFSLAVSIVGWLVKKLFYKSGAVSGLDRLIGAGVGLIKGVILLAMVTVPLQWFPEFYKDITKDSQTAPHLEKATVEVKELLGVDEEFFKKGLNSLKEIKEGMPDPEIMKGLGEKLGTIKEQADKLLPKEPQDKHSKEDQKKLNKLVQDVTKE